jgi:hypothetical protein
MDRLPVSLNITSEPSGASAFIDGALAGTTPITVQRRAGRHHVELRTDGFEPYAAEVNVQAGEAADLRARLEMAKTPITKRWWFWAAVGTAVAGAAVTTYALTRPPPQPDGGSLGWSVPIR